MSLYEDNGPAAWIASAALAVMLIWKAIWHARRDTRNDKEGGSRQELIEQLERELERRGGVIENLTRSLDGETQRRRAAEEEAFSCQRRAQELERRIAELGHPP